MHASEPHKSGLAAAITLSVVYTECTLQPFIADLLSPRSESSCPGTIFYLAEDAPPDFLLSFAEDCGILIGAQQMMFAAADCFTVSQRQFLPQAVLGGRWSSLL